MADGETFHDEKFGEMMRSLYRDASFGEGDMPDFRQVPTARATHDLASRIQRPGADSRETSAPQGANLHVGEVFGRAAGRTAVGPLIEPMATPQD